MCPKIMNSKIIVDAFARVEFFMGSERGRIVKRYIDHGYEVITLTTTLSELKEYASSLALNAGILTGDQHFRDVEEVIMV
jgi:hypothetical protein